MKFAPFSIRWWLQDRSTGQMVIAQRPNLILCLCLAGMMANFFFNDVALLLIIGKAFWLGFAADEFLRGVNPMRKVLGIAVAVLTIFT
jgi:hypothetical protein